MPRIIYIGAFDWTVYSTFEVNEVHQFQKVVLKLEVKSVTVPHKPRICCNTKTELKTIIAGEL
jgi:hypothetical protein